MTLFSPDTPAFPAAAPAGDDLALALHHAPILSTDLAEPAPPTLMGFTVIRDAGASPSSKFMIDPPTDGCVIEYAIWHDWDIQHLYDLEHVWVHLDHDKVVLVEGSRHGTRVKQEVADGLPTMRGLRPVLYCEPGKHAIWASPEAMKSVAKTFVLYACGEAAGAEGVHLGNRFAKAGAYDATARDHRLARLAMRRAAFVPQFVFVPHDDVPLINWSQLEVWIPSRVAALIAALPDRVPHLAAVFLDCGDTLIDEATEVKRPGTEVVLEASEIPDAIEAVRTLHANGYPLALVADGPRETFENLLKPRGIWDLMQAHVISGDVGALKPSPKMFDTAMQALDLPDHARSRVVMVGNNLARDIRGANDFGLQSLFVSWSKKRSQIPQNELEMPDDQIETLDQLVGAIDAFEMALPGQGHG